MIESGRPSSYRPKPLGAFRRGAIKGFGLSEICSETSYTPPPETSTSHPQLLSRLFSTSASRQELTIFPKFTLSIALPWVLYCMCCESEFIQSIKGNVNVSQRYVCLTSYHPFWHYMILTVNCLNWVVLSIYVIINVYSQYNRGDGFFLKNANVCPLV